MAKITEDETEAAAEAVRQEEEAAEDAVEEAAEIFGETRADANGRVLLPVEKKLGWGCYYRTAIPEKKDARSWSSRMNAMAARHGRVHMLPPQRGRPIAEQLARQICLSGNRIVV